MENLRKEGGMCVESGWKEGGWGMNEIGRQLRGNSGFLCGANR